MSRGLFAENLRFAYEPGRDVLIDVSLQVVPGGMCGIVGPNGSGKSTLLRLAAGLLEPLAGDVMLEGRPLPHYPLHERARMLGFLPQGVSPVFSLSSFEVVCLGRYPHAGAFGGLSAADRGAVQAVMERTNTWEFAERPLSTLSGGERQRVLLASVLAQEADILLLDEPTAALDIHHEVEVFAMLRGLADAGYGVGVVTHDLNLAAQYCDSIVLLGRDHRIVASGTPEAVFREEHLALAYGGRIRVGTHPFAGTPFVAAGSN